MAPLSYFLLPLLAGAQSTEVAPVEEQPERPRWELRFDMGGAIPQDAKLTQFHGNFGGEHIKFSPGFQMDIALDYKITPWLAVGPEMGLLFNYVDSLGSVSYHDTYLSQMPLMANVMLEYPTKGRVIPFIGGGIGGVATLLTFGDNGYYEPDGSGSDFSLGFQAVAGVKVRLSKNGHLGIIYRYLYTDDLRFDVEWWDHTNFDVGIESVQVHSFCLVFTQTF